MSNRSFIFILIILLQLGSCRSSKKPNYNNLKNIVFNKDNISYSVMLFFQTDTKGELGYIGAFSLRKNLLYGKKYKNCDLDSLLSKAIRGDYVFSCMEMYDCFEFSNSVSDCYQQLSFKSFLKKFTRYNNRRKEFIVHPELPKSEELTVLYFLYLNGYYSVYDDYEMLYFTRKGIKKPIREELKPEDIKVEN